jgi:hypothetical protein
MNEQQKKMEDLLETGLLSKPDKVSPSTLNDFIERRGSWYLRKVAGISDFKTSDYLQRGKGVESGLECLLQGGSEEDALDIATKELMNFKEGDLNEVQMAKLMDHKAYLGHYVKCAWDNYQKFKMFGLKSSQAKVSMQPDFCSFELYGYVDFMWSKLWTDLKILGQKPSGLSQGYMVQGAVYYMATKCPGIFTIVVRNNPKAGPVFNYYEEHLLKQKRDIDWWWNYVRMAAIALDGVYDCAQSGDVDRLIKHMSFPNLDAFYGENDIDDAIKYWSKL